MTGLEILAYILIAAGVVALALLGLNALGWSIMGEAPTQFVVPGTAASSTSP